MSLKSQVQSLLGKEKTWTEEMEEEICSVCPKLSYTQRLTGCIACMAFGFLLDFGSFFRMSKLLHGDPTPFVMTVTLGNIVALCGTCFLSGPQTQVKRMFKKTRRIASILYIVSIVVSLAVCFGLKDWRFQGLALLFCVIVQWFAALWYCLSYIPFARQWAKSCCKSCCACDDNK